jgi:ABC-type multidrug transport system, ATPase and permease components
MQATRKLAIFLKPYWLWAVLAPLLMALEVAMDLAQPRLIEHIIDVGIAQNDMTTVVSTGIWMVGLALIGMVGGVGCGFFTVLAGQGFGFDLREALFKKVQSLSFRNLDQLETGGLITRLTNDVTQVQEMVMMMLRIMVRTPLLMVGSLIMAVITSPKLALIFLVLVPIITAILVWVINKTFPMFGEVQHRLDKLNTVMQENLAGVRVVKAFARAQHEIERFGKANDALMQKNINVMQISAVTMPVMMLTLNAGVIAALWFGGNFVQIGDLKVGELVAFINYLTQTLMSLMMVSMLVVRVARAEASAKRIAEVLETEPAIQPNPQAKELIDPKGEVVFKNVTFNYNPNDNDPVLKQISFEAKPGETVAILGATGAGKSSLVNLIPRFYDITDGSITIDGQDIRALDETSLRKHIGIALQETVLFTGTIRDNIRYGRPEASDEEVIAAAKMAQAHNFIMSFPDGYDTQLGQRGVNLSGGQKQRLAIARALLTKPRVLILDDSTSAVDVVTESKIQTALASLPTKLTRIVVAQRISTVLQADKILVLDDGEIVAEGKHASLLETSPIYREIYQSQMDNGAIIHD